MRDNRHLVLQSYLMLLKRSLAWTVHFASCALLFGLAGCVAVPAAPAPELRAVGVQDGDQVTIKDATEHVTIDITSARGIGKAEILRTGPAPQALTFNLHLKGLEELRLSWGNVALAIHVASGDGSVRQEVSPGGGQAAPIDSSSPYWAPVVIDAADPQIPLTDGSFSVAAPPAFLQAAPQRFALQWIDFYR